MENIISKIIIELECVVVLVIHLNNTNCKRPLVDIFANGNTYYFELKSNVVHKLIAFD